MFKILREGQFLFALTCAFSKVTLMARSRLLSSCNYPNQWQSQTIKAIELESFNISWLEEAYLEHSCSFIVGRRQTGMRFNLSQSICNSVNLNCSFTPDKCTRKMEKGHITYIVGHYNSSIRITT